MPTIPIPPIAASILSPFVFPQDSARIPRT
jgi:hypothetical protein